MQEKIMFKKYTMGMMAILFGFAISITTVYAADTNAMHHAKNVRASTDNKKVESTAAVNINTADVKTLMTLKHIGAKRAAAIVAYRDKNVPFSSAADLKKIKGITQKMIDANSARIQVSYALLKSQPARPERGVFMSKKVVIISRFIIQLLSIYGEFYATKYQSGRVSNQ
jgi:competence protein ComEA